MPGLSFLYLTLGPALVRALSQATLVLYSAVSLHLWPAVLEEFTTRFDDIYLSNNYLVVSAGGEVDPGQPHGRTFGQESAIGGTGFTWRSERLSLSPHHRLIHVVHDHTRCIAWTCAAALLALLLCCRCACCGKARQQRKPHAE